MISLIVAASTNNVIGNMGQLPWRLPNDFKFFKGTTWGMPVIMGRKTFESLGCALPGRFNVVVTRQKDWTAFGAYVVQNLAAAVEKAREANTKELFIIGGGEIFKEAIGSVATRIYMTRVHAVVEGDAFFPAIDESRWKLVHAQSFEADKRHAYGYTFETWDKI